MITNYKLTDLQENSIEKMSKMSSCILALSPGCGKSLCVLHYLEHILLKDNRAFCKYICPVTIFLKPASYFSYLRVKCDHTKCIKCRK